MQYRTHYLRKDDFHSLAKSFANAQGLQLTRISFNGNHNSDKIISILEDAFLSKLTKEQRKELSDFTE